MKEVIDPDILGKMKKPWDLSNAAHVKVEIHEQTLFNVRHGLKDETVLKLKEPKVYEGCDSRNLYYHGWDVSNEVPIMREHAKKIAVDTAITQQKTKYKNDLLIEGRYKTPY